MTENLQEKNELEKQIKDVIIQFSNIKAKIENDENIKEKFKNEIENIDLFFFITHVLGITLSYCKTNEEVQNLFKTLLNKLKNSRELRILNNFLKVVDTESEDSENKSEEERYNNFIDELIILTKKYGIVLQSTGGVSVYKPKDINKDFSYSKDITSGDLDNNMTDFFDEEE